MKTKTHASWLVVAALTASAGPALAAQVTSFNNFNVKIDAASERAQLFNGQYTPAAEANGTIFTESELRWNALAGSALPGLQIVNDVSSCIMVSDAAKTCASPDNRFQAVVTDPIPTAESVSDMRFATVGAAQQLQVPYVEDGFQVTSAGANPITLVGTNNRWQTPFSIRGVFAPADNNVTFSRTDGAPFRMKAIDMTPFPAQVPLPGFATAQVTFTGTTAAGAQVTDTVNVPVVNDGAGRLVWVNFVLPNLSANDVVKVEWFQPTPELIPSGNGHAFTNIQASVNARASSRRRVDLVFNVGGGAGTTVYNVLEKVRNETGGRLTRLQLQLGAGVGGDFKTLSARGETGLAFNAASFDPNALAVFDQSLFGPTGVIGGPGLAGLVPAALTTSEQIDSAPKVSANYFDALAGNWLPAGWVPMGIVEDQDGDPATVADQKWVAWWRGGNWFNGGTAVDPWQLNQWAENELGNGNSPAPAYFEAPIAKLSEILTNYAVDVADAYPNNNFTIRMTMTRDRLNTTVPGWIGTAPPLANYLNLPKEAVALASSVLPASRSVMVNAPATAFATILNGGSVDGKLCGIELASALPAGSSFTFQTTDPATNAPTGTPNQTVNIPAGGLQTFVIALSSPSPVPSTPVQLNFSCANGVSGAPVLVGINTLQFAATATPAPDIVALGGTPTGDGILTIDTVPGAGVFVVSTANVGAPGQVVARPSLSDPSLPLTLAICETDPATSLCKAAPAEFVAASPGTNETNTFAIFATANGAVPFDAAKNRIFVNFRQTEGSRGATSVAVRTP